MINIGFPIRYGLSPMNKCFSSSVSFFSPGKRSRAELLICRKASTSVRKKQQSAIASYYRGGTSRAIFFNGKDLPPDRDDWSDIFRGVIGSPDPNGRQLDGMGGGISSLSKICVVSPSLRDDADVDYTFAAIGVKDDSVDYSSNCGNMTSAVGPYAIDSGILKMQQSTAENVIVRIHNTNSGKIIHSTFPISSDEASAYGEFSIDGVAGKTARIKLDFIRPGGSRTGKLLPTGSAVNKIVLEAGDEIRMSCVDAGNPCVFVLAADLNVTGSITPDEIDAHPTLLRDLDFIRRSAAVSMGLAKGVNDPVMPGSVPKICMVAHPSNVQLPSGQQQSPKEIDILARALSVGQPHRAIPITVALALAAACKIPGSVAYECVSQSNRADPEGITLGHASGKIVVSATYDDAGELEAASVFRTARRLMEGRVFWK